MWRVENQPLLSAGGMVVAVVGAWSLFYIIIAFLKARRSPLRRSVPLSVAFIALGLTVFLAEYKFNMKPCFY